jgi:hypothetical protein
MDLDQIRDEISKSYYLSNSTHKGTHTSMKGPSNASVHLLGHASDLRSGLLLRLAGGLHRSREGCELRLLLVLYVALRSGEARDRQTGGRAGDVVQAGADEEADGGRVAAVLA